MKSIFSREELYELFWSEAVIRVAARFQISDVALKKRCVENRIPVPGRGYWRQLETGKRPKHVELPKVANAGTLTFNIRDKIVENAPTITDDKTFIEYETNNPIVVADQLSRPAPETKAVLRDFRGQNPDDYGAIKSRGPDTFQVRIRSAISRGKCSSTRAGLLILPLPPYEFMNRHSSQRSSAC